jgi:hypothetical protein
VSLDGLFGSAGSSAALRRMVPNDSMTTSRAPLAWKSQTLAPNQSILIPTRIVLASPKRTSEVEQKEADQVFARVGANGFDGGSANFSTINAPDYVYGPEIALGAISFGGKQVDLRQQAVNFMDMTASLEAGSCPFLLAWDESAREWVNQGKVLHKASGAEHEYTEVRTMPGFTPRFRIEEREAEVAFIDHAEVSLLLANGKTVHVGSSDRALSERDGSYLELYWGDAFELEFALPAGVQAHDVSETRIALTGYYRRYSALMAENNFEQPERQRAMNRTALPSISLALGRSTLAPVCAR